MFTFNVGPSQISENTKKDVKKILEDDILQISHRSEEFSEISKKAIDGLRNFFQIPKDYKIFYVDSATKAMELCLQNCCKKKSFHFVNGAFSQLFANVSKGFGNDALIDWVAMGEKNDFENVEVPDDVDFIALTHTETSTGVQCSNNDILKVRKKYCDKILAVDITSSAGACAINIKNADLWFFSVQKCFGLPSGLGICILSPQAYQKSLKQTNLNQCFSFQKLWTKMDEKYQTVSTPNVFGIYLLAEKLKRWNENGGLEKNINKTRDKKKLFFDFIKEYDKLDFFVKNAENRADTVFYLKGEIELLKQIHQRCFNEKIILGKGYGKDLKDKTLRIANFPVIQISDLENLIRIIKKGL